MSIIDPKYRGKYRGTSDWLTSFVDAQVKEVVTKQVTTTAEDGTKTVETVDTKNTRINLDSLFALAKANNLNVDKYADQVDRPNAAGRLRMTIGNMLRSAAKKRHGLYNIAGEWNDADAEFIGDAEKTHNADGSKIQKVKAEAEAEAA